jgi:hypothetical protein
LVEALHKTSALPEPLQTAASSNEQFVRLSLSEVHAARDALSGPLPRGGLQVTYALSTDNPRELRPLPASHAYGLVSFGVADPRALALLDKEELLRALRSLAYSN